MPKNADPWYDATTGKFWREAGCLANTGYRYIWFQGRQHMEHRVAWFLHYGEWPAVDKFVDHINGIKSDNRISNLRLATPTENARNRHKPKNNTSGHKGVSWNSGRKAWTAMIKAEGSTRNLGYFATREAAADAYNRAAVKHHGEFAKIDL